MPFFRKGDLENAPEGVPAPTLAPKAIQRSHPLTLELLDWLIHALEAVISTPQVRDLGNRRVRTALHDALKLADELYPHTQEAQHARVPLQGVGAVPGAVGHDEADPGASGL